MNIKTNEETIKAIQAVMAEQEEKFDAVRIYIAGMGCSGPSFGLTLDEVKEDDAVNKDNELTFVMEQNVYDQVGDIIVELVEGGYMVKPVTPAAGGCSSCGGSCG